MISQVVTASYTDSGGQPGSSPLSAGLSNRLNPKQMQLEHYNGQSGVEIDDAGTAQGGFRVESTNAGDWLYFEPMNFHGIDSISMLYSAANNAGGQVMLRLDAPDGPVVSTLDLPATGNNNNYASVTAPIAPTTGTHRVYFVLAARAGGPTSNMFNLDEMTFNGKGVAVNAKPVVSAAATPTAGETPLAVAFTGTASDPEGSALTYAWDFTSDGTTDAATKDATHTYTQAGTQVATFTATDADGRSSSTTVTITVHPQPPDGNCFSPGSDQFDGTALDTARWDEVAHDAVGGYTVGGGALNLIAGAGTFAGNATNSPPLILQEQPDDEWTLTTKVTFDPTGEGQQAGLLLYQNDDNYIRLSHTFAAERRVELFKEDGGAAVFGQSVALPAGAPTTLYLRVTFNGADNVRGYWSADGGQWTPVATTTIAGINNPDIGVYANNGNVPAGATPTAAFDWVGIDDAVRPCLSPPVPVEVGGTVPGTLSLSIGGAVNLGAFQPGLARDYEASVAANVISTAGDATLTVHDAGGAPAGHLVNGSYALARPLQARASSAAAPGSAFAPVTGAPSPLLAYGGPVSNDAVTIGLRQPIGANDPLRTGTYSKTLTFTLSTTTP